MKPSFYLKHFPADHNGETQNLLFSTRTCSFAMFPKEIAGELAKGKVPTEYAPVMARLGMAVESLDEELSCALGLLAEVNRINRAIRASIILGMACNFSCVYCYEGSKKEGGAMEQATAEKVIAYLKARFNPETEKLVLNFYGGETLLYLDRIRHLTRELKPFTEEREGKFAFHLVSNGSLLSPKVVEEMLTLGLKSAKITLDGPEENHNRFRPFKSGEPSFATVLANVKACCKLMPINLVGNYTRENYPLFPALLDRLLSEGLKPDDLQQVQFYPAMQINDQFANSEFSGGCCSAAEPWLIEAAIFIRDELGKRGFPLAKMQPAPCMVDIDDAFTIDHDGLIYKCITMIGHQGYEVGDIINGIQEGWQTKYCHNHWRKEKKCRECKSLPLCFGGCRYMVFQREGSMARVDCQKEFLDATLEKMLMQDLKYRYAAKEAATPNPAA